MLCQNRVLEINPSDTMHEPILKPEYHLDIAFMGFTDDVGEGISASSTVAAVHVSLADGLIVGVGKQHLAVPGAFCLVPAAHKEAVEVQLLKQVQRLADGVVAEKRRCV